MAVEVLFEVEAYEIGALELAARHIVGRRRYEVLLKRVENGWDTDSIELELLLDDPPQNPHDFPDEDLAIAHAEAIALYEQIRADASLPPAPAIVVGLSRVSISEAPESVFVTDAEELFDEQRFELVVVAAQIACEVVVRHAMDQLFEADGRERMLVKPSKVAQWSLRQTPARLLFFAATGRDPHDCDWWAQYAGHVTRRNNIVHQGVRVTRDDARESLDAMRSFINFVREAAATVTQREQAPSGSA
jgi:hypothetical protein